jgi:hypothetical protein
MGLQRAPLGIAAILMLCFALAVPSLAGKGDLNPSYSETGEAIAELLASPDRLELPIQRIRPALTAHYVENGGTIYWVGTGRMTPFIQRLQRAADDGLNPGDYPIEPLIEVRDAIDASDPQSAARAELYFSAFFVAYAADLKIGRVIPQKVDPRLFRSRKTIDVLRVLTDLKKYREPGKSAIPGAQEDAEALSRRRRVGRMGHGRSWRPAQAWRQGSACAADPRTSAGNRRQ